MISLLNLFSTRECHSSSILQAPDLVIDKVKLLVVLKVVQKAAAKGRRKVSAYLTLRRPSPAPSLPHPVAPTQSFIVTN